MSEYCTPRNHVCIGEPTCRKPPAVFLDANEPLAAGTDTPEAEAPAQDPTAETPRRGRPPKATDTPKE